MNKSQTTTVYLVIDPEIDPSKIDANGMSEAIVFFSRSLRKAKNYRNTQNDGIDEGEPHFFIVSQEIKA